MIATNDVQDIKKEKILEAAYQRFLHYGYSKTTMNEIAGDLSMSKALLYYYFPDKSQLYTAVMRRVAGDYIEKLTGKKNKFSNLKDAFEFQIESSHEFMLKNYNFFDFFRLNEQSLPDMIWETVREVHDAEKDLLISAIKTAAERKEIKPVGDPCEMVGLLLNALHGVRISPLQHKKTMFPNKEQLEELRKKRLMLNEIFIRGLK